MTDYFYNKNIRRRVEFLAKLHLLSRCIKEGKKSEEVKTTAATLVYRTTACGHKSKHVSLEVVLYTTYLLLLALLEF